MEFQLYEDAGIVFSPTEKSLLRTSIEILKQDNNLNYIKYWGKIEGIQNDYTIIKGWNEFLGPAKYFFSTNCSDWTLVPEVDPRIDEKLRYEQALFIGNPTRRIKFRDLMQLSTKKPAAEEAEENAEQAEEAEEAGAEEGEEEEGAEEEEEGAPKKKKEPRPLKTYTEDQRLAVTINQIEHFCGVVPRGFLALTATHTVTVNTSFRSLTQLEALKLSSYLHLREPQTEQVRRDLETPGLIPDPFSFLDTLEGDKPYGSWALQYNTSLGQVELRSFVFPGSFLFLRPNDISPSARPIAPGGASSAPTTSIVSPTSLSLIPNCFPQWEQIYQGTGIISVDFAFSLPPVPPELSSPHLLQKVMKEYKEAQEAEKAEKEKTNA